MKIAADANCFIDAVDTKSHSYPYLLRIIELRNQGFAKLFISRHSLHEIREPKGAVDLANSCELLPHYPIGAWDDQIGNWDDLAGTWNDAKLNQATQQKIQNGLAKSGTDIRDRGAYVDALSAGVDVFMTSDGKLVKDGPASRIAEKYGLQNLLEKYPPFTKEFLSKYPMSTPTHHSEFLILGYRK